MYVSTTVGKEDYHGNYSLYVVLKIAYIVGLADVVTIHRSAVVQESSMHVQQPGMLPQGFDNRRKLLLQNGGCHLGHCVAELVRVTGLKGFDERHE